MKLIPAIDLMGGKVVQAQGGIRRRYRPLRTNYFTDASPIKVIQTLSKMLDLRIIYLADLDAITKQGNHNRLIADIHRNFPELELWVDSGIATYTELTTQDLSDSLTAIVGTETLNQNLSYFVDENYILSLDFQGKQLLGHNVLRQIQYWPSRTIVLSLDRIGSCSGTNIERLKQLRTRYAGELYVGGGIHNQADLKALANLGVSGALVATALYTGTLLGS
ncbi:MAG: nickel transporter [Chromatiales bacterium]|nr:nickel transporter [Chromatiales bacterium]